MNTSKKQKQNKTRFGEFLVVVKFDLVGFYFIKQRSAGGGNLGSGLTLLEGACLKLAPKPAA